MLAEVTETAPSSRARTRLTRERIVEAAIAVIERDGLDAFSMRRLGAELGVEAMALYHYVEGRDELVSAVAERILEPLQRLAPSDDWRDACTRFATALRQIAVRHPATFKLVGLHPLETPASLEPVERLLDVLLTAGFAPSPALAVYRAVAAYARGYALAEAAGFTVDAAGPAGRSQLSGLPPEAFPILAGRVGELADLDSEEGFAFGLRALLAGVPQPG